jgi:hypothetical protein
MPKISTASDLIAAAAALTDAVSQGEITPGEAASLSTLVGNTAKAVEIFELADRLAVSKSRWPRKQQRLAHLEQSLHPEGRLCAIVDDGSEDIEARIAGCGLKPASLPATSSRSSNASAGRLRSRLGRC